MEELNLFYNVTKESILNQISEEQIFNFYLSEYNIKVTLNNKHFRNPIRNDNTEGCNFGIANKSGKLLLFDWAYKTYSCFDFVIDKYKINFGDALKRINKDIPLILSFSNNTLLERKTTIIKSNNVNNNPKQIKIKRKLFTKKELDFWLIEGLDITPMTLHSNKIYSIEAYSIDDNYFKTQAMSFAYHWSEYNYQLYFPNGLTDKFKLKFLISANLLVGDEEFINKTANHLIITKSKKDAFYLRQFNLNAIFIVREKTVLDVFTMSDYRKQFKNIFVLFDNDRTGLELAIKYRKQYSYINVLYFNKKKYKKDFTDNLKFLGVERMKELIVFVQQYYNIEL